MPLNNNLFGVYKSLKVSGRTYVAESANRNVSMEVDAKNYIQGSPKARVLNIGGTKETISITAPILVGAGSAVDGRELANTKIAEILDPTLQHFQFLKVQSTKLAQMALVFPSH